MHPAAEGLHAGRAVVDEGRGHITQHRSYVEREAAVPPFAISTIWYRGGAVTRRKQSRRTGIWRLGQRIELFLLMKQMEHFGHLNRQGGWGRQWWKVSDVVVLGAGAKKGVAPI